MDGYKQLKFIVLIVSIVVTVVGCNDSVEHLDSTRTVEAPTASPLLANGNSNSGTIPYLATSVNIEERGTWAEANKAFEAVPAEFQTVDFGNLKYPFGRLVNGELIIERDSATGGTTFSLESVRFIDLIGDRRKEAVVSINAVSCGGSCDGGAKTVYFFTHQRRDLKRLGYLGFGPPAYGCSLKTLQFSRNGVEIEQFGKCTERTHKLDPGVTANCKFCVSDVTRSSYVVTPSGLRRTSIQVNESPTVNVMNYPPLVRFVENSTPE